MYQTLKRSASPEFECIDRIYEKNVIEGKILDAIGNFDELVQKLSGEENIVIMGEDRTAQDTYDLLLKYGIDICCFAVKKNKNGMLLGKPVISIAKAMRSLKSPAFINSRDTQGALGVEWTEYFDYRGYRRNEQFFLIRDYTDIPDSNLIHVLHGRRVWLTGDSKLCQILMDYLTRIENNNIFIKYVSLSEKVSPQEDDILCLVLPDYHNRLVDVAKKKIDTLARQLEEMGFVNYTEYFISNRPYALIDHYLNYNVEKYTVSELIPKGILIGRIPAWSGNVFFRGTMDGHPEILNISYSDLNENLFYYCMRLSEYDSDEILSAFWEMYNEEAQSKEWYFPNPKKFDRKAKQLLSLKEKFTSQELFVLFHIAYAEMLGREISDISKMVIYWEPHHVPRNDFPFFALWLEDEKIDGQTIVLRRNHIVRTGSGCARAVEHGMVPYAWSEMFLDESAWDGVQIALKHWTEFKMRFEDIKLNPREKLAEVCKRIGIDWSDSMLKTTDVGRPLIYRGSVDFDLKAVFNKYEDFLSEFDRFRISIACSPYQKKYGYSYDNCLRFSRRKLQELFIEPLLYEGKEEFRNHKIIETYELVRWRLWNVRKHMVLDDIIPEFERFEVGQSGETRMQEYYQEIRQAEKEKALRVAIEYAEKHDKLILYGTGNDCKILLKGMGNSKKRCILYSDKRAEKEPYIFMGREVVSPRELCGTYKNYYILVTSSMHCDAIEKEFNSMGVDYSRVYYNRVGLE